MPDKNNDNFIYSQTVMIIVLVLSYAFDLAYYYLSMRAQATFTFLPVLLIASIWPIAMGVLIALITWFAFTRTKPRSLTQLSYLVVGLVCQIFLISSLYSFPVWLRGTFIETFRQVIFSHGLTSNFSLLTALLMILGIIGLVRKPLDAGSDDQISYRVPAVQ